MPTYTNKAGLPGWLATAIANTAAAYEKVGDISITRLIASPMRRRLELLYPDVEIDVCDVGYSTLGKGVHSVAEGILGDTIEIEHMRVVNVRNWDVSGTLDVFDMARILWDIKVCSTWTVILGDKPEWEAQLNGYAWLLHLEADTSAIPGIQRAVGLGNILWFRDWSESKARTECGYPEAPIVVRHVPLWEFAIAEEYFEARVALHQWFDDYEIEGVPICTPGERWQRPGAWKVYKNKNKRATKNFEHHIDAEHHAEKLRRQHPKHMYHVKYVAGTARRCEAFCEYAQYCPFGKRVLEGNLSDEGLQTVETMHETAKHWYRRANEAFAEGHRTGSTS